MMRILIESIGHDQVKPDADMADDIRAALAANDEFEVFGILDAWISDIDHTVQIRIEDNGVTTVIED